MKTVIVSDVEALFKSQGDKDSIYFIEENNKAYMYDEKQNKYQLVNVENKGLELNLYDLNKNIINQLEPMTKDEILSKADLIEEYYKSSNNNHHMLLCRDYNYYTIFEKSEFSLVEKFADTVIEIITELGEVYSIEMNEDKVLEIWIKPTGEENPYVFYLFPYDAGVVYYE